ncbi:MAG: hypothetical protein IK083_04530 [Abditibacteriota bacterium]|nr:hypothetical protein [Abditibacteriota bacterium]
MLYKLLIGLTLLFGFSASLQATVFVYSHRPNGFLTEAVRQAFPGMTVTEISGDGLTELKGSGDDILAVIDSQYFPKAALPAFETFVAEGNHYLGLCGLPFTDLLQKAGGNWLTGEEMNREAASLSTGVLAPLSTLKTEDFTLNSSAGTPAVTLEPENGMLHIRAPRAEEWQTYTLKSLNETDVNDDSYITFSAKGSLRSPAVWIFLQEKDGSRWNKKVDLTGEVRRYAFRASDFTYWQDSRSSGRGLDGDSLHLSQLDLAEISIMAAPRGEGVALMDTVIGDPVDIYIGDLGYYRPESAPTEGTAPDMHCIYPAYEMHETEGSSLTLLTGDAYEGRGHITSPLWRNRGYGTGYKGPFRQVPLSVLYDGGEMRGVAAEAVYTYDGSRNNVYAYIGSDPDYLEAHPDYTRAVLKAAAERLTGAPFIVCGGLADFSVLPGEKPEPGMTVRSAADCVCRAELLILDERGREVFARTRQAELKAGQDLSFKETAPALRKGFFTAVCRLCDADGRLLDRLEMPFSVYAPEKRTAFNSVTQHDGDFWLKGKKWVPYGINYWPSYAVGLPVHEFFDLTWQHPWQYDPVIIERDFDLLDKMGINCISFGLNHGGPMRDVAMRAEKHGIKLHIATGGTHPCGLNFDTIRDTVGAFDIAKSSAVFSYDLGW